MHVEFAKSKMGAHRGGGGGDRRGKDPKHDNSMDKGGDGERRGKERTKETTSLSKKSDKEVDERKVDETVKQIEKFLKLCSIIEVCILTIYNLVRILFILVCCIFRFQKK